jgi:hypothetical protein
MTAAPIEIKGQNEVSEVLAFTLNIPLIVCLIMHLFLDLCGLSRKGLPAPKGIDLSVSSFQN